MHSIQDFRVIFIATVILGCTLIVAACTGSSSPGPTLGSGGKPSITRFTATPANQAAPGPVTLAWEVTSATSLEIDGGVGSVTPLDSGTKVIQLGATTTFTLTAKNAAGSATATVTASLNAAPSTFSIDPSIQPSPSFTSDGRGGTLPLAASKDEQGVTSVFIANQVLIVPRDQAELSNFLAHTGGQVVEKNSIPAPPPELGIRLSDAEREATTYTVRLDPSAFPLGNFSTDWAAVGLSGKITLSSNLAARLMAFSTSEVAAGRAVGLNYLSRPDTVMLRTEELPCSGAGCFADAFSLSAFKPTGSKSNVLGAWQWMRAKGMMRRVRVAIIDGGFWVDRTGQPNSIPGIGTDLPAKPIQYDFVNDDSIVGDENPATCSGGTTCQWHGNGAAGTALGLVNNQAGAAGTGGLVADPMLLHINLLSGQEKWALAVARSWGADVINMSFGGACNYTCRWNERIIGLDKEYERVRAAGIVMVAAAGNDNQNVDTEYIHPCNQDGVICVGALNDDANTKQDYSNYGSAVGIWSPTNIYVMPDGADSKVHTFGGTSAASPFVAGVAAMMKAVNPGLSSDQARDMLRETGWTDSGDPHVSHYINALAAVKRASNDELPPDRFEPNSSVSVATVLNASKYDDLSIHKASETDFYRFNVVEPSKLTLSFTSPDNLGRLGFGYGLSKEMGCGWQEELPPPASAANKSTLTYRVPSGIYTLGVGSSSPLPYDMTVGLMYSPTLPDAFEPNNSLAQKTALSDGRPLNATLHPGDIDFYEIFSAGSLPAPPGGYGYESLVEIRAADGPITLTLYDSAGKIVGAPVTSSADCNTLPKLGNLPQGWWSFSVTSSLAGKYALFAGQKLRRGKPLYDMDSFWRLLLNPLDPIEFIVRDRLEWAALVFNQNGVPNALDLSTPGLHMALFDDAGLQVAKGVASNVPEAPNESLDLRHTVAGARYYLRLERNAVDAATVGQLPVITAKLRLR